MDPPTPSIQPTTPSGTIHKSSVRKNKRKEKKKQCHKQVKHAETSTNLNATLSS
jgi:hypothetical protein